MTRLLLAQGLPYSTAALLNALGWDVVHVTDLGMQRASDQEIIDYSREQARICMTLDADFHHILAISKATTPSVIRIRQEGLKGADVAQRLHTLWPRLQPKLKNPAMVTITHDNIRIRYLPLS